MRRLLLAVAVLEVLVPERVVRGSERLAFENPGVGRLRPWTIPLARLEGVAFCWLAASDRLDSPGVARLLGLLGVPAFLAPTRFVEAGLAMAYENPADLEVKPWVVRATRLLGVCYVALALFVGRADAPLETEAETAEPRA